MKTIAKKSSFFNAFSIGIVLSCLGTNVFKCEATPQEEVMDGNPKPAAASPIMVAPNILVGSENLSHPPILYPIKVPTTEELQGNTFWPELVSLQATDPARKARGIQGQEAFSAVTDLATLFEDYKNASIISGEENFLDIVTREECKLKVIINDHEMELPQFRDSLVLAIRQWPILKDCFFSLNQSVVLLRKRILADFQLMQAAYEREVQLAAELMVAKKMATSWSEQFTISNKRVQELESSMRAEIKEKVGKLEDENASLRSQISQSEELYEVLAEENRKLKEENARLKAATEIAITIPQDNSAIPQRKPGFWAWIWSWFQRTSEKQRF